jgi:glycerol-3-phosphate dehydrogenase
MRREIPSDIERTEFDLIVIGAGINGVAIARDAALRGLQTLVLDKDDVGGGTTATSTRLIHGGLRYLEHREFDLVRESLRERERLLHNAPHLVTPIPMLLPIYAGARRGPRLIRMGMLLYDVLSFDKSLARHRMLDKHATTQRIPGLATAGLRGGALYYDAQSTFAERLAVDNALDAARNGALIVTHARVDRITVENGAAKGVAFEDLLTGNQIELRAKAVVNVAGPWVDQLLAGSPAAESGKPLIGGTKGSHIVVAPFPGAPSDAVYFETKSDGRAVFVVPWNGLYLIGSTDIRYTGDLDDVRVDDAEIDYFVSEANALFPGAGLTPADALYGYSGVRPLPHTPAGSTAAITRRHVIHDHAPRVARLWSIIGGKLTTHRALAEEAVDAIARALDKPGKAATARRPLPGGDGDLAAVRSQLSREANLPSQTIDHLIDVYGIRAQEIAALASGEPALAQPIDAATGAIAAEVLFAVREEGAVTLADILLRRTMIGLAPHAGVGPDAAAAAVAQRHLGWDDEHARREVAAYRAYIARFRPRSLTSP